MLADILVRKHNGSPWQRRGELFLFSLLDVEGEPLVAIKPLTFMNRSGLAVAEALSVWSAGAEDLIVAHDDLDLAAGKLRIRPGGGHGGHNGIRSIVETIGVGDFARVKLGVGRPPSGGDTVAHVLGDFGADEWLGLAVMLGNGAEAVEMILREGVAPTMNRFNGK